MEVNHQVVLVRLELDGGRRVYLISELLEVCIQNQGQVFAERHYSVHYRYLFAVEFFGNGHASESEDHIHCPFEGLLVLFVVDSHVLPRGNQIQPDIFVVVLEVLPGALLELHELAEFLDA